MEITIQKMSLFSSLGNIPSRKDFLSNIRTVCSGAKNRCRIRQEKEICAMSLQILQQKCSVSHDQIETSLANWSQSPPTKFFRASPTTFSREINKGRHSLYYSPVFCLFSLFFVFFERGCWEKFAGKMQESGVFLRQKGATMSCKICCSHGSP